MSSELQWDEFVEWARRFYAWPDFDKEEREYKQVIAARLRAVRDALHDGDDQAWIELLQQAMRPPNNLVYWTVKLAFPVWCGEEPAAARLALMHLWDETVPAELRVHRFMEEVPGRAVKGQHGMFASFLLIALDPTGYPMYRDEAYRIAYRLTGYPDRPKDDSGAIYQHGLNFLDTLLTEAHRRGLTLRDRLDAQSVLWCVTWYKVTDLPMHEWPESDRERLLAYREESGGKAGESVLTADVLSDQQTVWMFQFNPDNYDLEQHVQKHGPYDWWEANQNRQLMRVGQRVYFMQSGGANRAALVAAGRIVSEVYPAPEGSNRPYRVDVWYEARVVPPIERHQMREDDILAGYRPYAVGMYSTNFPLPPTLATRTAELLQGRLQPFMVHEDVTVFDPASVVDSRTRVVAAVVRRQGQPEFRQRLLAAYGGRCAVTGCDAEVALEAAHIVPYRGPETNHPTNGLLLRADIHILFDLGLLAVDSSTMTIVLASALADTTYADLSGGLLHLPSDLRLMPSKEALDSHRQAARL